MLSASNQYIRVVAAAIGLVGLQACTTSLPSSSIMPVGAVAVAPAGFVSFCRREPEQCGLGSGGDAGQLDAKIQSAGQEQWAALFAQAPGGFSNVSSTGGAPVEHATNWRDLFAADEAAAKSEASVSADLSNTTIVGPFVSVDFSLPLDVVQVDLGAGSAAETSTPAPLKPSDPALQATAYVARPLPVLDDATLHLLENVNQTINRAIVPGEDSVVFGEADYWALPLSRGLGNKGNCKHYALEKRKALIDRGVSPDALSLAIVKTTAGETHAVLLVATDRGEFVLDNLSPWILPWSRTSYTWLERQALGAPMRWRAPAVL